MKTNDQKSLERLYEQVTNNDFMLLKEEDVLFDAISSLITKEVQKVLRTVGDLNGYSHSSLGQIVHSLSDTINAKDFVCKYFPSEIKEQAAFVYFAGIIYYIVRNKVFLKKYYEPEDMLCFEFETSGRVTNVKRRVDVKDKEKFKQSLKEWFVNQLEFMYASFAHEYPEWDKWRENELKYEKLKQKHSELKGIF